MAGGFGADCIEMALGVTVSRAEFCEQRDSRGYY